MKSITAESSRAWIDSHPLKLYRYLRRNHRRADHNDVLYLLYVKHPDEGRKLLQNFSLTDEQKKDLLLEWIIFQPQITCGVLADQRMGKDATMCEVFTEALEYCEENKIPKPRIVTLNNMKCPPFVDEKDMYYSFKHIPSGTAEKEVWIYCSEIETVLPAREGKSPENQLFNQLEGTMAQNHQKLFGCSKLLSKVDINFIRSLNCKIFKFISPEKLKIENVERGNVLSELGYWHLPKNPFDKTKTLLSFDDQLFTVCYNLPVWWSERYSEQFREVPIEKVWDYVECQFDSGLSIGSIQTAVSQKFRTLLKKEDICARLGVSKGTK